MKEEYEYRSSVVFSIFLSSRFVSEIEVEQGQSRIRCREEGLKRFKGRLVGAFSALQQKADCTLTPK